VYDNTFFFFFINFCLLLDTDYKVGGIRRKGSQSQI
jgi:hypothetical protein